MDRTSGRGNSLAKSQERLNKMKYGEVNLGQVEAAINKLGGLDNFNALLRGELEVRPREKDAILRLISGGEYLTIGPTDGSEIISEATDIFTAGIDSDFKNWGANERGPATSETSVEVYEMVRDANFVQMFGSLSADPRKRCLTQAQVPSFIRKHRSWLRSDGYATFFLFESNGEFFVARVNVRSDGRLNVDVHRFEIACVWNAEYRHRLVVPQVA